MKGLNISIYSSESGIFSINLGGKALLCRKYARIGVIFDGNNRACHCELNQAAFYDTWMGGCLKLFDGHPPITADYGRTVWTKLKVITKGKKGYMCSFLFRAAITTIPIIITTRIDCRENYDPVVAGAGWFGVCDDGLLRSMSGYWESGFLIGFWNVAT